MNAGNVFAPDTIDRGPWKLYDRLLTAAGANTAVLYQFFSVPIAGAKTKVDTNLLKPNGLPPPRKFDVDSIGFIFGHTMYLADVGAFLRNYYFELVIGDKVFAEGPLQLFPGGAGLSGISDIGAATPGQQSYVNGLPSPAHMVRFGEGYRRTIPANVYFGVRVIGNAFALAAGPAPGLDLLCVLDGIIDREVQ